MTVGAVVITTEEYKELIEKSLKYDLLRKMAIGNKWLTDREKMIYEFDEEEENEE